jgi:hypothetical protein
VSLHADDAITFENARPLDAREWLRDNGLWDDLVGMPMDQYNRLRGTTDTSSAEK